MTQEQLIRNLQAPAGHVDVILDTDAYNEIDDQFAIAYLINSQDKATTVGLTAAPFFNQHSDSPEDGMIKSYEEILNILRLAGREELCASVYEGSRAYLPDEKTPVDSPAARFIVEKAQEYSVDRPLYVLAIGAITNVASAILMEPEIVNRIVVVWLGGQMLSWPTASEFNLSGDLIASRLIFDCGVPLIQVPCMGVASHLLASVPELQAFIGGKNPLCDALVELFAAYADDTFGWAKEIWDVSTIGVLMNPDWSRSTVEPSPILSLDTQTYARHAGRHPFRIVSALDRNAMFRDMYRKLAKA